MSNGTGTGTNIDGAAAAAGVGLGTPTATPVTDFYTDATVLITGGTGFVGKVLTEKLLRAFGLRKIYMLIRSKDNMSVQERLQGFLNESVSQQRSGEMSCRQSIDSPIDNPPHHTPPQSAPGCEQCKLNGAAAVAIADIQYNARGATGVVGEGTSDTR